MREKPNTRKVAATGTREFHRFLLMAQFEAKEIGARIALARKEKGLTQEELAELAPFSTRSLQDYERGEIIPYRQMRDIAKLLDRPVEWFLHGEQPDEPAILEQLAEIDRKLTAVLDGLSSRDDRLAAIEASLREFLAARAA
jgi:transcriptional regulator with XRE-family HTH domain